ncbi:MAG: nucleotidyltransferase substrate binding protein [bacterium]
MEKIKERFNTAEKTLTFLKKAINDFETLQEKEYLEHLRNSKIQSFEFCVDTLWKFLRLYFKKIYGVDLEPGPKPTFRYCFKAGLVNEEEAKQLLNIVDDRNLSSHTYHEEFAEELNNRIEKHYLLMKKIVDQIKTKLI